uniref:Uncharacterized protein n=1 Tax=Neobodo designis TaxID=312471 RepID=A0A7S1MLH7_NEODS|mmetsp:Transcript_43018/g.132942  ORF Transcript_43018/g.132942 Transcript_43018/m.132942 type:complete len:160 (+) Transcript_43018:235-714(+)
MTPTPPPKPLSEPALHVPAPRHFRSGDLSADAPLVGTESPQDEAITLKRFLSEDTLAPSSINSSAGTPGLLHGNASALSPMSRTPQDDPLLLSPPLMPSGTADEGWRRVLHGMLQRDPQRRTRLPQLRRQLVQLEQRMEEADRLLGRSTLAVSIPPEPL